jgi:hypothetical protein
MPFSDTITFKAKRGNDYKYNAINIFLVKIKVYFFIIIFPLQILEHQTINFPVKKHKGDAF